MVRNLPANVGDVRDSVWSGSGRSPGGGHGNPSLVFLLGVFHGQRSLAGYSPWSHKELDMIEHLSAKYGACKYK